MNPAIFGRSFTGTSGVSNPKLVRCLRKSLVPTLGKQVCHIVSSRSVFYQQFIGTNFGFHPGILISTCRLLFGISCPTNNCKAEELSDSSKIWVHFSFISPIPVYTPWQKLLNATDSWATTCPKFQQRLALKMNPS